MKKAQGLSMNTIIIAAIALLVLVILSVIFMGRMGWWSQSSTDCLKVGGTCMYSQCKDAMDSSGNKAFKEHPSAKCYTTSGEKEVDPSLNCCIKIE